MRRPVRVLVAAVLLAGVAVPFADAAKPGTKAPKGKQYAFTLESGVLSLQPDVAKGLAQVEATPNDPGVWRSLGQILVDRAGYNDAIRALEIATKLAPNDPDAWADLGAAYIRADKPGSASGPLHKAIKLEPYHALAHYNLGLAEQARGNYDAAFAAFEYALVIDPKLGDPKINPGSSVNPYMPFVKLQVYMKTVGAAPALFAPVPNAGGSIEDVKTGSEPEPARTH